ncbi:MAG: hypothetical protein JWO86_3436 [Myxococcaceae bacterium]|nr:hypothetical protein [Myxococcaceae bacterium]
MPESPASSQRPFDFADLGRPMPKSVRTLPPAPQADASGQLEELSADDIMESDDIDALEAAAAGFSSFEVGEVGAFDEVQVEGIATRATEPAPEPARIGAVAVIVPAAAIVEPAFEPAPITARTPNQPSTLQGFPAAPATSPLPLEDQEEQEESVIISEPAPATPVMAERTLEIRGNDMAKVAAAAAQLTDLADSEPQQTEILVRSAMPPALQQKVNARPSSIAPVALDVSQRPPMPRIPPMARVPGPVHMPARGGNAAARPSGGLSGLAIGGMAAAAILLVSLVGIGGYAASRTLSAKTDAVESSAAETAAAANAPSEAPAAPAPSDPSGAASSPIDVSSLPSAPVPGATPRGFTGKGSFAVTPPPPVAAPVAASPVVAAPVAAAPAPAAAPVARSSGGALAAPGGGGSKTSSAAAGSPLAAPPSAPTVAAAPAAPKPVATTGVVNVDPNLRAVVVDGSFRRANDGVVTVSCGSHRIKAGMKEAQTVNVPCGGAVSL